jgi:hypothetical protein
MVAICLTHLCLVPVTALEALQVYIPYHDKTAGIVSDLSLYALVYTLSIEHIVR